MQAQRSPKSRKVSELFPHFLSQLIPQSELGARLLSLLCSETAPSEAHTLIRSLRQQEVKRVPFSWCVTYFQSIHPSWQSPDSTHPMTKIIKRRHQMQVVVSYPHPPITVPSIPSFQRLHLRTRSATSRTAVERDETTCRSILLAILFALRWSTIPELGQTCPHLIDCDSAAPTPPRHPAGSLPLLLQGNPLVWPSERRKCS